jgi:hypothetical protein
VRGDEGGHVGEHLGGGAREASISGLADGAAPAALVEAVDGDSARRERVEKGCVAVDVVAEAVEEDELGFGRAIGLDWRR